MRNRPLLTPALTGSVVAASTLMASAVHAQTAGGSVNFRDFSGNLTDVIADLYGGDGIRLQGSDVFSHAAHFTGDSLIQFNQLSLGVRDLSFPVLNPQIGVRFKYDAVLDEFVPTTEIGASAFAFDAETVGAGEFHLGLAYSVRNFDELGGQPLNALSVDLAHMDLGDNGPDLPCIGGPPGACYAFERDVIRLSIDLDIEEEMFALTGAYGLTDRMDFSLFLPLLQTEVAVTSSAAIVENSTREFFPQSVHLFGGEGDNPLDAVRGRKTGIGDTVLRLNYALVPHRDDGWNFNAGVDVRLPTGRTRDLQGLPRVGIKPRFIASRDYDLGAGTFRPHFNIAYGFNSGILNEQVIDYAVGGSFILDWGDSDAALAVGADFLGKNVIANKDEMGDNQYDVSFGMKLNLKQSFNLYYSILLPLNDSGLRPDAQHVFGLQVQF